jgi:hypothetical protein
VEFAEFWFWFWFDADAGAGAGSGGGASVAVVVVVVGVTVEVVVDGTVVEAEAWASVVGADRESSNPSLPRPSAIATPATLTPTIPTIARPPKTAGWPFRSAHSFIDPPALCAWRIHRRRRRPT